MVIYILTGWWFQPLWKTLICWDDDIPNRWKVIKKQNVPNHQPDGDLHIKNCDVPVTRAEKNHDRVESRVALRHEFGAVETGGLVLGTKYMMCPVNEKSIIIYILW